MDYQSAGQAGAYIGGASGVSPNVAKPLESLSDNLELQLKRLDELANRLDHIADNVHGPTPQPAGAATGQGEIRPMSTIASRVRDLSYLISRAEAATNRIQGGL